MSEKTHFPVGRLLVVGLGNPGLKYRVTRHNIGFRVVQNIERKFGCSQQKKFAAFIGNFRFKQRQIITIQPQTFMNRSGQSVGEAARFWKLASKSIIIIHDDLDLPLGKIKIKFGGGNAGHNGLRSIDSHLNSKNYYRIRVGIDRPPHGKTIPWVLGSFASENHALVEELIELASEAIERLILNGLQDTQSWLHPQNLAPEIS